MRYEPANTKFFDSEVKWSSFISALKLLDCFKQINEFEARQLNEEAFVKRNFDVFEKIFCTLDEKLIEQHRLDENLYHACHIMRYLYDTAIDSFDKPFNRYSESQDQTPTKISSSSPNLIDEPLVIHRGALITMLYLCPCISSTNKEMQKRLQYQITNLIRYDKNQQIIAHANFVDHFLIVCKNVLNDELHFLNTSIQHIFERLASALLC